MATAKQDFSIVSISNELGKRVASKQQSLMAQMDALGDSPSPVEMMRLQASFTDYQVFTGLQSGLVKEIGDTLKAIVQKAA